MSKASYTSAWSLPWLITFWTLILGSIILVCIASTTDYLTSENYYGSGANGGPFIYNEYINNLAWGITLVGFNSITLILNFVSVIRHARGKLTPLYVLISNVVLLIGWIILFVTQWFTGPYISYLMLVGKCVLILTSAGQITYSAVLYHRQRRQRGIVIEDDNIPMTVPPSVSVTPVVDDDDSGFEEPVPDYKTVVGSDGGISGNGMQKYSAV